MGTHRTPAAGAALVAALAVAPLLAGGPGASAALPGEGNGPSTTGCANTTPLACAKRTVSADGRRVVFASEASNLVPGDTNGAADVFVAEIDAGAVARLRRISVPDAASGGSGSQGDGDSGTPAISPNGEWVAFESEATNLTGGDNDAVIDVFVAHLPTGRLHLASVPDADAGAGAAPADGLSFSPSVADDGSVAFTSYATRLVTDGVTAGVPAVYVRRRPAGAAPATLLVSAAADGEPADGPSGQASIDAAGGRVAFTSTARNIDPTRRDGADSDDVFVRDLGEAAAVRLTVGAGAHSPSLSPDGDQVAFVARAALAGTDTDDRDDVYMAMATVGDNPALIGGCACDPAADRAAAVPSIAAAGTVVFQSDAPFAGAGPAAKQVWAASHGGGGNVSLVSRTPAGAGGEDASEFASVSADGSWVAYTSEATNLVARDENGVRDVFLTDLRPGGATIRVSVDPVAAAPTTTTTAPAGPPDTPVPPRPSPGPGYWMVSADGRVFAFGAARDFGDAVAHVGNTQVTDLEPTPTSAGYWIVDRRGRVFAFGDAVHLGNADRRGFDAAERVTSISATPTGRGYWIFTTRGRVLALGDAEHFGDMTAVTLNGPVLDSVPTPSGRGYYMVAADGGIFTFGDAVFHGSMGGVRLNAPVQSLVPDADHDGYWLVASDGGVFSFDAPFRGSMGAVRLNRPVTGMVRFGDGYLMVGEDGGIFNFSDRPFLGSLGAQPPAEPIVSVAATG